MGNLLGYQLSAWPVMLTRISTLEPSVLLAQIAIPPLPGALHASICHIRNLVLMKKERVSIMVAQPAEPVILLPYEVTPACRATATIKVGRVAKGAKVKMIRC